MARTIADLREAVDTEDSRRYRRRTWRPMWNVGRRFSTGRGGSSRARDLVAPGDLTSSPFYSILYLN